MSTIEIPPDIIGAEELMADVVAAADTLMVDVKAGRRPKPIDADAAMREAAALCRPKWLEKVAAVRAERRAKAAYFVARRIAHYAKAESQLRAALASLAAADALGGAIRELVPDVVIARAMPKEPARTDARSDRCIACGRRRWCAFPTGGSVVIRCGTRGYCSCISRRALERRVAKRAKCSFTP